MAEEKAKLKNFIVTETLLGAIRDFTPEQAGHLFKAMAEHGLTDCEEEYDIPDPSVAFVFKNFVAPYMDNGKAKYEKITKRNHTNGAKGGRPPKNPEEKAPKTETQEKQQPISETQNNPKNPMGFSETQEKPIEIEIGIEREIEIKNNNNAVVVNTELDSTRAPLDSTGDNNKFNEKVIDKWNGEMGLCTAVIASNLTDLAEECSTANVLRAIDKARLAGKVNNYWYVQKVARGLKDGVDYDQKPRGKPSKAVGFVDPFA